MSFLKPGTLCVIVGGCPKNIGLVVEVLQHLGPLPPRADVYLIRTASRRNFPQLKMGPSQSLKCSNSNKAITDRHKLRPLVDLKDEPGVSNGDVEQERNRARELVGCTS